MSVSLHAKSIRFPVLKESAGLRYLTYFYLYTMQGIPAGFALTAITNYLIGKGVSALSIGALDATIGIPWVFQFIWGPLIDRFQYSRLGHRKHWILYSQLCAFLTAACLLLVQDAVRQISMITSIFFIHSIFASIQDAAVDASAISLVPTSEQGRINAWMRSGLLLGVAIGAAGFSTILHLYGFYAAAGCQLLILGVLTLATWVIKFERSDSYLPGLYTKSSPVVLTTPGPSDHHEPADQDKKGNLSYSGDSTDASANPELSWLFRRLYQGIMRPESLRAFGIIALVYLCMSIFYRSFSFQLIHTLHWDDRYLSVFQGTWGSLLTIVVTLGGGILADRIGPGKLQTLMILAICFFFLGFNSLGFLWAHRPVSLAGLLLYNLADPLFSVAAMPVLMALCLAKVEGSQFTAYMALVNLCDVIAAYVSGIGMTYTSAPVIGIICGMALLTALFLQYYLRSRTRPAGSGQIANAN